MEREWQKIGCYRAVVNPRFDSPALREALADIESISGSHGATLLQAGRHRTIRISLPCACGHLDAVVKFFGRQSLPKDVWDRLHGTKAWRTYAAANHLCSAGIGTTPPIACIERWKGPRLSLCAFVSVFVDDMLCFKDWLGTLWRDHATFAGFKDAIAKAAEGIRQLHDSGCSHGDLGNQNIFFTKREKGGAYIDALFLDLNRARFSAIPLDEEARAKDLARIWLPEGLLPTFYTLYWRGEKPSKRFLSACRAWRRRFRIHSATRKFRHPLRELAYTLDPRKAPAQAAYPPASRQWIWDAEGHRPAPVVCKRHILSFMDGDYRRLLVHSDRMMLRRLEMAKRFPESLNLEAGQRKDVTPKRLCVDALDVESALLASSASCLGKVLVRISEAEPAETVEKRLRVARALKADGFGVAVQILPLPRFAGGDTLRFTISIVSSLGFEPDWICAGQGINSIEWGIRSESDLDAAIEASAHFAKDYSGGCHRTISAAIESPVMQTGCGNISRLLGKNVRYCALALAWNKSGGSLAEDLHHLRRLAAGSFYSKQGIVVICDELWCDDYLPADHALAVTEICAPSFA